MCKKCTIRMEALNDFNEQLKKALEKHDADEIVSVEAKTEIVITIKNKQNEQARNN